MNTGTIARRYAKALLLLTGETGRWEQVCAQINAMLENPSNPPEPLEKDLQSLLELLRKNGRMDSLKFVFYSFLSQYYRSRGVCVARLVTASPSEEGQRAKLSSILEKRTGMKVQLQTRTDPSLLGGFVLDTDEYTLDASVNSALNAIRRTLSEKQNRTI